MFGSGRHDVAMLVALAGLILLALWIRSYLARPSYENIVAPSGRAVRRRDGDPRAKNGGNYKITPVPVANYTNAHRHGQVKQVLGKYLASPPPPITPGQKKYRMLKRRHTTGSVNRGGHLEGNDLTMSLPYSQFRIIPNPGNGDCFFYACAEVIREMTGGKERPSTALLRATVADSLTKEHFEFMYNVYQQARRERDGDLLSDYSYMRNVESLEDMRSAVLTRRYYGDEMAIRAIEGKYDLCIVTLRLLNYGSKIEMARRYYGEKGDAGWYAMLLLDDDSSHYELVEFGGRVAMRRDQLPDKVQRLLLQYSQGTETPSAIRL